MLFNTEIELGLSNRPNKWVNHKTLYTDDGGEALYLYANICCPASQLIQADTDDELKEKIEAMRNNFKDETWLNENLYPYI